MRVRELCLLCTLQRDSRLRTATPLRLDPLQPNFPGTRSCLLHARNCLPPIPPRLHSLHGLPVHCQHYVLLKMAFTLLALRLS